MPIKQPFLIFCRILLFLFLLIYESFIFSSESKNINFELYYSGFSPLKKLKSVKTDSLVEGINLKFFNIVNLFYEQNKCNLIYRTVNVDVKNKKFGGFFQTKINKKINLKLDYEKEIPKMEKFSIGKLEFLPVKAKTHSILIEGIYKFNNFTNLSIGISTLKGDFESYNHEISSCEFFLSLKKRIKNKFILTPSLKVEKGYVVFAPEKIKKRDFSKNIKFLLKSEYILNKNISITCIGGINNKGIGMQNNIYEGIGITTSFRFQYFKYEQNFQGEYQKLKKYMEDKTGYLYFGIVFKI